MPFSGNNNPFPGAGPITFESAEDFFSEAKKFGKKGSGGFDNSLFQEGISPTTGLPIVNPEIPGIFQDFLSDAKAPGGFLGPAASSAQLTGRVPDLLSQYYSSNRQSESALRQGGVNRSTALGFTARDPFRGVRDIEGAKGEIEAKRVEDLFGANQNFANFMAEYLDTETQRALDEALFLAYTDALKSSASKSATSNIVSSAIKGAFSL
jgi:hypothetical protein